MSSFKFFQTPDDNSTFLHPLAPGSHGIGGYGRVPGSWGTKGTFSDATGKFAELKDVSDPFSPAMHNRGSENIHKIEKTFAYGPEDVPKTMRKKGWNVAASLIEYWLNGNEKVMPESVRKGKTTAREYGAVNTGTVTMAWLQGFARARISIAELKAKLASKEAKEVIKGKLIKNYPGISINEKTTLRIDNSQLDVVDLHTNWQFQFQESGSQLDQLDELTAALGRFSVMAAIRKASLKDRVLTVSEVGFYVKDIFDFSGWQPLGCWTDQDVTYTGLTRYCTHMSNDVFGEYRIKTGKGMDFIVFSDILAVETSIEVKI